LRSLESAHTFKEFCRDIGFSDVLFYNWKTNYGGMEVSDVVRMNDLQDENAGLKRIVANLTLKIDTVKTVLENLPAGRKVRRPDDK
jgi:putative transposase